MTDALVVVADKLGGPFNMELAADSIAVKVSEGIMHMQENLLTISTKARQHTGIDGGGASAVKKPLIYLNKYLLGI